MVGENAQGLEGKEGGKMREKGWEEKGSESTLENSDFSTPLI